MTASATLPTVRLRQWKSHSHSLTDSHSETETVRVRLCLWLWEWEPRRANLLSSLPKHRSQQFPIFGEALYNKFRIWDDNYIIYTVKFWRICQNWTVCRQFCWRIFWTWSINKICARWWWKADENSNTHNPLQRAWLGVCKNWGIGWKVYQKWQY